MEIVILTHFKTRSAMVTSSILGRRMKKLVERDIHDTCTTTDAGAERIDNGGGCVRHDEAYNVHDQRTGGGGAAKGEGRGGKLDSCRWPPRWKGV